MSDARARTLITVADLARLLGEKAEIVLLDVLDDHGAAPADRPKLPGAISVHLSTDFSGRPTPHGGRRPLPHIMDLQANARRWGISPDAHVVVYDNAGGAQASRAWWTLRWGGHPSVRILDGGLKAWQEAGHPVSHHHVTEARRAGTAVLKPGHMPTIEAPHAAALARRGVLLDARGKAAYVGEPGKAATGHIPGARSLPSSEAIAGGRFKPTEELAALYATHCGEDPSQVGVYCGSGNAAAHAIAAMTVAGFTPPLYVGSWSAWTADPSRPVATGADPG